MKRLAAPRRPVPAWCASCRGERQDMDATQGASPRLPINFFLKEVTQKQATLLPRQDLLIARNRFRPNFRGVGVGGPPGGRTRENRKFIQAPSLAAGVWECIVIDRGRLPGRA